MNTLKRLDWRWDKASCILWAAATLSDGSAYSVGIPLAHVVATFDAEAAFVGVPIYDIVGDEPVDSVEGLFSKVKKLAKKVTPKIVQKAVARTQKTLAKGVSAAGKVVTSKYTRIAVTGLAVAFPAVGGPAVAALAAANAAYGAYRAGDAALTTAKSIGKQTLATASAIRKGQNVKRAVSQLASRAAYDAKARFAVAALKSVKA